MVLMVQCILNNLTLHEVIRTTMMARGGDGRACMTLQAFIARGEPASLAVQIWAVSAADFLPLMRHRHASAMRRAMRPRVPPCLLVGTQHGERAPCARSGRAAGCGRGGGVAPPPPPTHRLAPQPRWREARLPATTTRCCKLLQAITSCHELPQGAK